MATKAQTAAYFKPLPRAPPSFYARCFGIGLVMGGILEFGVIKSGYYDILRSSEAKKVAKERMERAEADAALEELLRSKSRKE